MDRNSFFTSLLALLTLGCQSTSPTEPTADLSPIFAKTLIVGASISANYNDVTSPGLKLAEKFQAASAADRVARNGARSSEILSQIESKDLKAYSAIVAIDLFFWDSAEVGCDNGISNVQKVVQWTANAETRLILGDVPRLEKLPLQPCRNSLNAKLEDECRESKKCYLIGLNRLYDKLDSKGSIDFLGRSWTKPELLPDGLHLSPTGADYVAEEILRGLN